MTIQASNKFGIEIELLGLNRQQAANKVAEHFGTQARWDGGHYDRYIVGSPVGTWMFVTDGSLGSGQSCEVVSPPMKYSEMDVLQDVVRVLRQADAYVNRSCGIHVHVDASRMTPRSLSNISKMVYAKEKLMFKAFGTLGNRIGSYSRPMSDSYVNQVVGTRRPSLNTLKRAWYGTRTVESADSYSRSRYHGTRYHAFNLHSFYYRGTIEFRYFNGSLHAGKIKSYVQFCLALRNKAMSASSASARRREYNPETAKYDMRTWLLALGMVGEEFKTARHHLLKRLPGDSAYRRGRPQSA